MEISSLFPFGWHHYAIGGLFIGLGTAWLFVFTGRVGGMSSVFSSTWSWWIKTPFFQAQRYVESRKWRLVYASGLVLGVLIWRWGWAQGAPLQTQVPVWQLLVGGLLVGFGARLGNGCTSGHGICGLASFQLPSLGAVLVFMGSAFLTANLMLRINA